MVEKLVPWENLVEVPVEKVVYVDRDVDVPLITSKSFHERTVHLGVEKLEYEDHVVKVPVENIKYVDKEVTVEVDKPVSSSIHLISLPG